VTDQDAIARFEALVQSQQPASKPWTPVTDYSFEARKAIEGPHAELIKSTFEPRYVADYGCGPGHLVTMLREIGVAAYGFDKSVQRDQYLAYGDITQPWMEWESRYDLVICREVLEHLTIREIRHSVTNLCKLSSRYVYVTTRFHPKPDHLLDVATSDDLDPTHITMLNQDFLRTLFVFEGFKRRKDLEVRMDWKGLGRVLCYERT
jgi:2-polyprenyl-3-methyl-5-hydroxy-6-metoxy-1,4-benzoquinol methylase